MRKSPVDVISAAMLKHAGGNRAKTIWEKRGGTEQEVLERYIADATAEIYKTLKDQQEAA